MPPRRLRPSRLTSVALAFLAAPLATSHGQALDIELPAALRQSTATVYPQCAAAEKTRISGIISRCQGCLSGACPDTCCVEKPASNQFVLCDVPAAGQSPGCCIRVMGSTSIEVAASETVTAGGKAADGLCEPAVAGAQSTCPADVCAIAGVQKTQTACPTGVLVPLPAETFASPAKCADGSLVTDPVSTPAPGVAAAKAETKATKAPEASGKPKASAKPKADGAKISAKPVAPIAGVVPAGCVKTPPGFRCEGEVGKEEVVYRDGCCVGKCQVDPSKGWGKVGVFVLFPLRKGC